MTSLLVSGLKNKIAAAFKGKLTLGTLRRESFTGLDADGDPTGTTTATYTFEGIRESFTARYKAQAGIPDTDVAILILLGSCKPAVTPTQNDKIYLQAPWNAWFQVRKVLEIDPAGASARLQAYEIPAP